MKVKRVVPFFLLFHPSTLFSLHQNHPITQSGKLGFFKIGRKAVFVFLLYYGRHTEPSPLNPSEQFSETFLKKKFGAFSPDRTALPFCTRSTHPQPHTNTAFESGAVFGSSPSGSATSSRSSTSSMRGGGGGGGGDDTTQSSSTTSTSFSSRHASLTPRSCSRSGSGCVCGCGCGSGSSCTDPKIVSNCSCSLPAAVRSAGGCLASTNRRVTCLMSENSLRRICGDGVGGGWWWGEAIF